MFKISPGVAEKLRTRHSVTSDEIAECFANRTGKFFEDTRAGNITNPPTYWFVADTDTGRKLKVVFVRHVDYFAIKTAYEPTDGSDTLYLELCERHAG
ncbi:hypothetical protein RDV84_23200 [Lysobacter yananisis]|uniref:ADP-ribosyl-(Dinitrogen reductase) hydrolase n=1 Tax=Lysobacter yananisis TaxID=1003114 RepID=A0ABY9P7P7_9GAMM|nr:hypothetical protein [Lysobacter yananisis]WMT02835.1 hypothetical protein RDV84_23200 [Lysobacter yananisis]